MGGKRQAALLLPVPNRGSACHDDTYIAALACTYRLRGRAAIGSDLQVTHASQDPENLAGCALRVVHLDFRDLVLAHKNLERRRLCFEQHGSVLRGDIGDQIAETVHFQHHTAQHVPIRFGLGCIEAHEIRDFFAELQGIHTFGKIGSNRGKNISRMEGVAHGLKIIVFCGDVANVQALFTSVNEREHTVVGSDKMMPFGGDHDRAPRRPHTGIDNHKMHCAGREVGVGLGNGERAVQHIERLHRMADVHDLSLWGDVQDDALDSPHEVIVKSKISGQRNDRPVRQSVLAEEKRSFSLEMSKVTCSRGWSQGTEVIAHCFSLVSEEVGINRRTAVDLSNGGWTVPKSGDSERFCWVCCSYCFLCWPSTTRWIGTRYLNEHHCHEVGHKYSRWTRETIYSCDGGQIIVR